MRRLSAIMFTDMVGYSALTQENEALALQLLSEHRSILRPIFIKHSGREIETAGDSFFVEFNSAVEGTNCAIDIQETLNERNKSVKDKEKILLRIGLHIGDVVYMENHVHGDGVNIAARMEPLAKPGGICISEDVARQVRNKIPYEVIKIGAERLKNIAMPMDIYCVALPWVATEKSSSRKISRKRAIQFSFSFFVVAAIATLLFFLLDQREAAGTPHSKVRLAVLPFINISQDPNDVYFADGLTEELISSLSKIGGLNVIARTSIMKYKDRRMSIAEIGEELTVTTILDGSVRKFKDSARISIQLVDVRSEENIWADDYDLGMKDMLTVQSEIAEIISKKLQVRLVSSEKEQLARSTATNQEAYNEYLIGKHYLNQRTSESIQKSIGHFQNAVKFDSNFAIAYTNLAYAYTLMGVAGYGDEPKNVSVKKAREAANTALRLDSSLAEAHAAMGYLKFRVDWDWKGAEQYFRKAIELKPGYATAHEWFALYLAVQSKLDEALTEMNTALSLDPLSTSVNTGLARIYHFRGEKEKALSQIQKAFVLDSNYAEGHFTAGMTHMKFNNLSSAEHELKKAVELSHRRPVTLALLGINYWRQGKTKEANEILKELEKEPVNNDKLYAIASIKSNMGKIDEALEIYEKLAAEKFGILIYFKVEREMIDRHSNPRYDTILRKLGFE